MYHSLFSLIGSAENYLAVCPVPSTHAIGSPNEAAERASGRLGGTAGCSRWRLNGTEPVLCSNNIKSILQYATEGNRGKQELSAGTSESFKFDQSREHLRNTDDDKPLAALACSARLCSVVQGSTGTDRHEPIIIGPRPVFQHSSASSGVRATSDPC